MRDEDCIALLQWALPRLRMRWRGFRNVRRQVCRRIDRRILELGLPDVAAYRARLETQPAEWAVLDGMCWVTISRFRRDRRVWERLSDTVLPALVEHAAARGESVIRCWSAACASGEEPYSVALCWRFGMSPPPEGASLSVLATDAGEQVLERASKGCYQRGTLKELPPEWIDAAFERTDDLYRLRDDLRRGVRFEQRDVREEPPSGPFHLVLCRNLVLTYFEESLQREVLSRVASVLVPGGALVVGGSEAMPPDCAGFEPWDDLRAVYRRVRLVGVR